MGVCAAGAQQRQRGAVGGGVAAEGTPAACHRRRPQHRRSQRRRPGGLLRAPGAQPAPHARLPSRGYKGLSDASDETCTEETRGLLSPWSARSIYAQRMAEILADGLDIRYGRRATRIRWSSSGVVVACASGEKFHADAVIVTVSLGVLKAGPISSLWMSTSFPHAIFCSWGTLC